MEQVAYTIVFEFPGMPIHGAGPVATVARVDGVLPPLLKDPRDQEGGTVMGLWRLIGTDDDAKLAFYQLE